MLALSLSARAVAGRADHDLLPERHEGEVGRERADQHPGQQRAPGAVVHGGRVLTTGAADAFSTTGVGSGSDVGGSRHGVNPEQGAFPLRMCTRTVAGLALAGSQV